MVSLACKRRGTVTCLADLRQEGCLKARFPRSPDRMQAVMINTSGGIAGGDRLRVCIRVSDGAAVTVAGQAAERFYRALDDDAPAFVETEAVLAPGACLEWLPQEAIFFDGCAMRRTLRVQMAADATFLGVECLVFGRAAMGEHVSGARISDTIEVLRDGMLLLYDAIRMPANVAEALARPAVAAGARAIATLVLVAPDAEDRLGGLRSALPGSEAGASAWNGLLLARILASDAAALRHLVVVALATLRNGRELPRVWMC
jgi:urease accessory protein